MHRKLNQQLDIVNLFLVANLAELHIKFGIQYPKEYHSSTSVCLIG